MLLIIIRQTNGWVDQRTGRRKTRDRISHSQFMKKTSLCRRMVSKAVQSLVEKELVMVTCRNGNILHRAEERKGMAKMFYSFQAKPAVPAIQSLRIRGVRGIGDILKSNKYQSIYLSP